MISKNQKKRSWRLKKGLSNVRVEQKEQCHSLSLSAGKLKLLTILLAIVVQCGYIMVNGIIWALGILNIMVPISLLTGFLFFPALALMRVVGVCSDRRPQHWHKNIVNHLIQVLENVEHSLLHWSDLIVTTGTNLDTSTKLWRSISRFLISFIVTVI